MLGELRVAFFPNLLRGLAIEERVDTEVALQLQVRPMIQRIAQRVGNRLGPRLEFFPRRRIAGAKTFLHAVRPHAAPFIMIAGQPDLLRDRRTGGCRRSARAADGSGNRRSARSRRNV